MIISANFDSRTVRFIDELQLQSRSSYLEQLVWQDLSNHGCSHSNQTWSVDCAACYSKTMLHLLKCGQETPNRERLQGLKNHLSDTWLTPKWMAKCHEILTTQGLPFRTINYLEQRVIFQQAPFTMWSVYIGSFLLTLKGKPVFQPKDLRAELQILMGESWDTAGARPTSVLPSDASEGSKYANGYDCLRIAHQGKRPFYSWIGFDEPNTFSL